MSQQIFYTELDNALATYPKPSMPVQTNSIDDYEAWACKARKKLSELLGIDRMIPCDPEPQLLSSEDLEDHRREKWLIQTEPGIYMTFYLLIPNDMKPEEKRAAVICPHGHSANKDATAGNACFPEMAETISSHNYDYGRQAVRRGFIAACPDARGFGERREKHIQNDDNRLKSSCHWLNHMANPIGRCVAGMWAWDLMRLADWLTALPFVDKNRLGCTGLSGGGLQTLYFSALDERVKYAAISGYFYGFKESLLELHMCACNYVPHLWEYFDVGEIGALIAPRPLTIETGTIDPLNGKSGLQNVVPYVDALRKIYRLYGRDDDIFHDIFEGPHLWHGVASMERLEKYLKNT